MTRYCNKSQVPDCNKDQDNKSVLFVRVDDMKCNKKFSYIKLTSACKVGNLYHIFSGCLCDVFWVLFGRSCGSTCSGTAVLHIGIDIPCVSKTKTKICTKWLQLVQRPGNSIQNPILDGQSNDLVSTSWASMHYPTCRGPLISRGLSNSYFFNDHCSVQVRVHLSHVKLAQNFSVLQ